MPKINRHHWLVATLTASVLMLGACAEERPALQEPEEMQRIDDAQTPIEQEANEVADPNVMGSTRAEVPSLDGGTVDDTLTNEDIGVADSTAYGIDDADILDGSEQEEHISTY